MYDILKDGFPVSAADTIEGAKTAVAKMESRAASSFSNQPAVPITEKTPAVYGRLSRVDYDTELKQASYTKAMRNLRADLEAKRGIFTGLKGNALNLKMREESDKLKEANGLTPREAGPSLSEMMEERGMGSFLRELNEVTGNVYAKTEKMAQTVLAAAADPKSAQKSTKTKYLKGALNWAPTQEIVRWFSGSMPGLKPLEKMLSQFISASVGYNDRLTALRRQIKDKKAWAETAKFATFHQIDPSLSFEQQDLVKAHKQNVEKHWRDEGMKEKTGLTYRQAFDQGKALWVKLDPKDQENLLKTSRLFSQIRQEQGEAYIAKIYDLIREDSEARDRLLDMVDQYMTKVPGLYFPLERFGEYLVIGDRNGEQEVYSFETEFEQQNAFARMKADPAYDKPRMRHSSYGFKQANTDIMDFVDLTDKEIQKFHASLQATEQEQMEKTLGRPLEQDEKEKLAAATKDEISALLGSIRSIALQATAEGSAMKNSLNRKYVAGASDDMLRASASYMTRHANNLANLRYGHTLSRHLRWMQNDANLKAQLQGKAFNTEHKVVQHFVDRLDLLRNMPDISPVVALGSKLASLRYMTSPSVWLMQMSQLGITTFPRLVSRFGLAKSTSAMGKGLGLAFDKNLDYDSVAVDETIRDLYEKMYAKYTEADFRKDETKYPGASKIDSTERTKMFKALPEQTQRRLLIYIAMQHNMLGSSFAYENMALSKGQEGTGAFNLAMTFMRDGEERSRKAALMAGFDLYFKKHPGDFDTAFEKTRTDVTAETLFDYSVLGKPLAFIAYPSIRMATQFRFFQMMFNARMARMIYEGSKGDKKAVKEFLMTGAMGLAMSGARGAAPMAAIAMAAPVINAIYAMVTGDDDDELLPEDPTQALANWGREAFGDASVMNRIVQYGSLGPLGMDVSRRIGPSDTLGMAENLGQANLKGSKAFEYEAQRWLGPVYSHAKEIAEAASLLSEGEFVKAGKTVLPKPVADTFKAVEIAMNDGIKTKAGRRLTSESLDAYQLALLATGMNPIEFSETMRDYYKGQQLKTKLSAESTKLEDEYLEAVEERDYARQAEVAQAMRDLKMKYGPAIAFDIAGRRREMAKKDRVTATPKERATGKVLQGM